MIICHDQSENDAGQHGARSVFPRLLSGKLKKQFVRSLDSLFAASGIWLSALFLA